jgi:hypothetical protein
MMKMICKESRKALSAALDFSLPRSLAPHLGDPAVQSISILASALQLLREHLAIYKHNLIRDRQDVDARPLVASSTPLKRDLGCAVFCWNFNLHSS